MKMSAASCGGSPYHEYRCHTCGRTERMHGFGGVEVRHEGRKREECGICEAAFWGIGPLIDHVKETHPDHMNEAFARQ